MPNYTLSLRYPESRERTSEWRTAWGSAISSSLKSRENDWMSFAEADNGLAGGASSFRLPARSLARESRLCQHRNHCGEVESHRRDMTTNDQHRLGTPVIVVRLMGCAFLRLLSQPADYDMLVASASERASKRTSIGYIPHTTCSRHRNAICPTNDSLALSVTEV